MNIALAIASVWGRMTVQRRWREWPTGKLIDYWVENDRHAHLAAVQSEQQIPAYRIAEDARIATDAPIDFALEHHREVASLVLATHADHAGIAGKLALAPIIGLVLCAPKFLSGVMTLGELTRAAAAFTLVQASFNWLVDNYSRIADWVSSLERVGGLLLSLDRLNHGAPHPAGVTTTLPAGPIGLP